eukprot:CAMPEP_0172679422 /NCGR_PEP_ID=MMETSP1074-20121228/16053_1 /TAXON_ID=2916 /ORGANISM="Ceratium fusus, Strain PA161109" /LENGTH=64 /DNA_ID=CAMNT_0013497593 /DNA_START=49 /DNA_END=243 /DNA_ORIENTATION=+
MSKLCIHNYQRCLKAFEVLNARISQVVTTYVVQCSTNELSVRLRNHQLQRAFWQPPMQCYCCLQ